MNLTSETEKTILDSLLRPSSVAVAGASARPGSLGNMVMSKIINFGFKGEVYPVNPKSEEILGKKCHRNISDIPAPVDVAVICVPGEAVIDVVKDCNKKGVKACIIISAGFKEIGGEGIEREKQLNDIRSEYGMKIIGPNCFGIINGAPDISFDCTFARSLPSKGHIGFVSQSGALGACVLEDLRKTTMGFSLFVSLGNRSDMDENEAMQYLAQDPNTRVIFLYLENFANPSKFIEIAKKITPHKPIIALKAGKSAHGAAAAASHTGMLAQSDKMVEAIMEKAGVIRVDTVAEMINTAKSLYSGIIPEKEDLAIITNAGGFGVLAIDKAESLGVKLAEISPETTKFLEENLPREASCHNPVDLLGTAVKEHYAIALEGLLSDPNIGGVVCNFGPPVMQSAEEIAEAVEEKANKYPHKPVLSVYMNRYRIMKAHQEANGVYVPQFDYPEEAVEAYAQMLRYKHIKNRAAGKHITFKVDKDKVERIIDRVIADGRDRMDFDEGEEALRAYGIPLAPSSIIKDVDNLEVDLSKITFPVAIKPVWGGVTHKTEMNAVRLNLMSFEDVENAFEDIRKKIEEHTGKPYTKGFVVQEMLTNCREVILGASKQDSGIHLIMFGLGGIFVELLKDVAFAVPPLTNKDAGRLMEKVRGYPLLKGFRGKPGVTLGELQDVLLRFSSLINDHPRIKELDINPFMASSEPGKSGAVDIRIIV
ncbi:MAG: acetate--CoA ligase family protein [Firmicutes bacterium]|nr:acetate--CoA ligase family protein [Bacillota bacterium]